MKYKKNNCYLIGIDGGDWEILKPLAKTGYLPNLKKIIKKRNNRELISTLPPLTAPAWSSFLTGVNPGKHSIFFWQDKWETGGNRRLLTNKDIKRKQLPEVLNQNGIKAGLINFPFTYPIKPTNGYLVSGMLSPNIDHRSVYPQKIISILKKHGYLIGAGIDTNTRNKNDVKTIVEKLISQTKIRTKTFLTLNKQINPRFRGITYVSTDRIQHMIYNLIIKSIKDPNQLSEKEKHISREGLRIYKEIDNSIGKIVTEAKKDDLIIIISDHGFQLAEKQVNINRILIDHQLLYPKLKTKLFYSMFGSLRKFNKAKRYNKHLKNVFSITKKRNNEKINKLADEKGKLEAICLNKSLAFSGLSSEQGIYLTKKGEKNYKSNINNIIYVLKNARNPETKELLFNHVKTREKTYRGKWTKNAPPIIFSLKPGYKDISPILLNNPLIEKDTNPWRGDHRKEGILLIYQKNKDYVITKNKPMIWDLLPTICNFYNIKPPKDIDGQSLI